MLLYVTSGQLGLTRRLTMHNQSAFSKVYDNDEGPYGPCDHTEVCAYLRVPRGGAET